MLQRIGEQVAQQAAEDEMTLFERADELCFTG